MRMPGPITPRGPRRDGHRPRRLGTPLLALGGLVASLLTAVAAAPTAQAAELPSGWVTVTAAHSAKCVDAAAAGTADGTAVQQYTCNGSTAQQWQFRSVGDGYVRVDNRNDAAKSWDVTNVSTADAAPVQLWSYSGGANQQWLPVEEPGGAFHFVNRNSGKCLDIPAASTADSARVQQYTCNGSAAQSFRVGATDVPNPPGTPDLGPNVSVFDPSTPRATIQNKLNQVFAQQETNQFGSQRQALLFKPGRYDVDANVGFYTQVAGLGLSPDDVTINGGVHVEADWFQGNATHNFWRSAENLSVNPPSGTDRWAVSQAAPYRRMHVRGNLQLDDGGWSSGGFMADSKIDGQVRSGTEQQWLSRNSQWNSWTGSNWSMVFVGDVTAPANSFPNPPSHHGRVRPERPALERTPGEGPPARVRSVEGCGRSVGQVRCRTRDPCGRTPRRRTMNLYGDGEHGRHGHGEAVHGRGEAVPVRPAGARRRDDGRRAGDPGHVGDRQTGRRPGRHSARPLLRHRQARHRRVHGLRPLSQQREPDADLLGPPGLRLGPGHRRQPRHPEARRVGPVHRPLREARHGHRRDPRPPVTRGP
ncbi:hypothetical protein SMICM17S_09344 [Streptomyces microflavus]